MVPGISHDIVARLPIPVYRNLFFGPKKTFLTGILRISFFPAFSGGFFQSKQPKFARTLARVRSQVRGRFVHTGFVGTFILDMFVDTKDTYVRMM